MPELYGEHVMLRAYRASDFEPLCAWLNDARTTRWLGSGYWQTFSVSDAEDYLRAHMQSSYNAYHFAIADCQSGAYLGQIDLINLNWRARGAEIAMVIGCAENRGKGFGREALTLMKRFAFDTLGLERLEMNVLACNRQALNAYLHAGFTREGVRRHAYFAEGAWQDEVLLGCLKGE